MITVETYRARRKKLLELIQQKYPDKNGEVILFAGFEHERHVFRQEGSFYYLTGIVEPGVVLSASYDTVSTLHIPNCTHVRGQWVLEAVPLTQDYAQELGVDEVTPLGKECASYQFHPFFSFDEYDHLIKKLETLIAQGHYIFTLYPDNSYQYIEQRLIIQRLEKCIPDILEHIVDISPLVAHMRRIKSNEEIEYLYKAIEITALAQEAAAHAIVDGVREGEVQASLEYMITGSCSRMSFPSIVATRRNATVLHYTANKDILCKGDLVVIDCGAEYEYYCGDITRTYPVSGTFTNRQKELYSIVLETQEYIASCAKPGMWLSHKDKPEQSLNHRARAFLKEKGYEQYFPHGIGHFLGIDVHDVGDYSKPLEVGDVITIEPGIYIREEGIGIRIEDNYWIVEDGVVCLSEDIPKQIADIESIVKTNLE